MATSVGGSGASAAREHIERMRRERYYIGRAERNPLEEDIQQAVNYLSEELYSKDAHFVMELIQNAEDNEYPPGVVPSLEFVITSKDITATGAESTLLVFNNEKGFSPANIDSICRIGKSTKKGNRHRGYIGEKGIGFKSVFLISAQPCIFSNGYQIRFNEEPCPVCNIGYIVPEWVEENPSRSDLQAMYGSSTSLPATAIILPLKGEKMMAVKQQLSTMHPELLLFLSNITRLSVREQNADPNLNTVKEISITSETDFQTRKNVNAESFTLHLAAQENCNSEEEKCSYYMWKQKYPVESKSIVKKRMEIDEWVITLAFPHGQRLNRGMGSPSVYAFLPTEMVTNFPFIIQADFVLASSRESMLLDSPWNTGILRCIPSAFVNAFVSLIKPTETAPLSSLLSMFKFFPLYKSSIHGLESVRHLIKRKLLGEHIIPCQSYTKHISFHKPSLVRRLKPGFWDILNEAHKLGVNLENLSSHGTYILISSFDKKEHDEVLEFLGVKYVDKEWYGKFIESSHLLMEVSDQVYLNLLYFVANNWSYFFQSTNIRFVPLIKYEGTNGMVYLWNIDRATQQTERLCIASEDKYISWLIDSNREFATIANRFFLPKNTQMMLVESSNRGAILSWLKTYVKLEILSVVGYANLLINALTNRNDVIAFTHFMYHSFQSNYLSDSTVKSLCNTMPLVDNYGNVTLQRAEILVPGKGSKWVELIGSNPWRKENYVELGADYMSAGRFAGLCTPKKQLLSFLQFNIEVSDIPKLCPPDAVFPTVASPLTLENVYVLLEWIRDLRYRGVHLPEKFLNCIKNGCWLRTSINHKSPAESFLSSSEWQDLLGMGSDSLYIPIIDQSFYGEKITGYKEELRLIGVRLGVEEALSYIGNHLLSLAANSTLTRGNVFSLLRLIRFLRKKHLSPEYIINGLKDSRWLKTSHHYRSPVGSILFESEWTTASYISDLPFIDKDFYGEDFIKYKTELELLGVRVSFNHQLVVDNIKLSTTFLTADAAILILDCIRYARSSGGLITKIREIKWLKTHYGYRSPAKSFLADSEWQCFVEVVDGIPLIDEGFYGGRIRTYTEELKKAGVIVSFEQASKDIAKQFKLMVSSCLLRKQHVIALLTCVRKLKEGGSRLPDELTNCFHSEKWLCTQLGFKTPSDSILNIDAEWEHLIPVTTLPFIDDSDSYYGKEIYGYRDELKALGVIVEFKEGAEFLITCLNIPKDTSVLAPSNVFSILECIQNLKDRGMGVLPKEFKKRISRKWLKTYMGFKSPDECILLDLTWELFLEPEDGPFLDVEFYGSEIMTYCSVLQEIGVVVDVGNGCSLLANHLKDHTKVFVITRIYRYLSHFNWKPDNVGAEWIWIQNGMNGGNWVNASCCVLQDTYNLFGSHINVLEKLYHPTLLEFFSMVLGVKHSPQVDDYCKLWKLWEASSLQLTVAKCSAFWLFITKHWNEETQKLLTESITKLPVYTGYEIFLLDKQDVFIPDDLLMKDLFSDASPRPIFIWYPERKLFETSRVNMNEIYRSIGVRKISEVVEKESLYSDKAGFKKVNAKEIVLKKGLLKIILGFLADSSADVCLEERHRISKCLVDLDILETDDPVTVSYKLALTSGMIFTVKATRMVRWEWNSQKLVLQNINMSCDMKVKIEFATYFSEVIIDGLFDGESDNTILATMANLIKLGCLLDFEPDAVEFLLKTKNIQPLAEDDEFLSSIQVHKKTVKSQSEMHYGKKRQQMDEFRTYETCQRTKTPRRLSIDGALSRDQRFIMIDSEGILRGSGHITLGKGKTPKAGISSGHITLGKGKRP